jgi:hypothetical protein
MQYPILVSAGDSVVETKGMTRDVSQRGAFFYTEAPVTIGQVVEFKLLIRGEDRMDAHALCKGTVIRVELGSRDAVQGNGVAVQIHSIELR